MPCASPSSGCRYAPTVMLASRMRDVVLRPLRGHASILAGASVVAVAGALIGADAAAGVVHPHGHGAVIGSTIYREYRDPQLVTWNGFELFTFSRDTRASSACSGRCSRVFLPVITSGPPRAKPGSQIRQRKLGTVRRTDGRFQVTYYHQPLYRARNGKIPCSGSTHRFGGTFTLINAAGAQPLGLCGPY